MTEASLADPHRQARATFPVRAALTSRRAGGSGSAGFFVDCLAMRCLFFALFLCVLPLQVLAHAQLRGAEPSDGSVLTTAPVDVRLDFNESVAPLVLRLFGPEGQARDLEGIAQNESVLIALPEGLGEGSWLLSWRVVSSDGHPVGGTVTFHIGAPSVTPPALPDPAPKAAWAAAGLRFVVTVALVLAVGGALYAGLVACARATPGGQRLVLRSAVATYPFGVALIGLQGLDLLALNPEALLSARPWLAALSAPVAVTVALVWVASLLAVLAVRTDRQGRRLVLCLAAWACAALSFAASGHASAAAPRALTLPAVALHGAAAIFWLGALLPLLCVLRAPDTALQIRRFSDMAVASVGVLVLSGALLTAVQAGHPAALAGSAYGTVLAAKLLLVAGLIGLAARNRLGLTPAFAAGQADAAPRLARAIRAEVVLGLVILALASGFRLTPPPRALMEPAAPLMAHIHAENAMADIRLTPGRAGQVAVTLAFQTGDFAELVPREVEAIFALPEAGIEPLRMMAQMGADGLWQTSPVTLPVSGNWTVTLRLLITDFEQVTLTGKLKLPD